MAFKKPERTAIRPRVLIIGDAKVGKTHAMLTFPGPMLVVDLESRIEVFEDRFDHFMADSTKDVRQIKEDLRVVREGRMPCETLGIDGLSVLYDVLQGAAMSSSGEIEVKQWGGIKRMLSSVLDEGYNKLNCAFVATARVKPKVVLDRNKGAATSEMISDGDVIDLDRKAAYLFDLMFRIRMNVEKRTRDVICVGSVYSEIKLGQTWPLPDGARFYDVVIKDLVESRRGLGHKAASATDEEAIAGNRDLFVPVPTIKELQALAEDAQVEFTMAWIETQGIIQPDPSRKILPLAERKHKTLYDEEKRRASDLLKAIIDAAQPPDPRDAGDGEPADEQIPSGEDEGGEYVDHANEPVGISKPQRDRIMAMFAKRDGSLQTMYPEAKTAETRRHAFAVDKLADPSKGSSKSWTQRQYKRVSDSLELVQVSTPE